MTSMDARVLVLEIALAELVAGLPATRVQSVTRTLELLADLSGDVEALACGPAAESLGHLRGWSHVLRDRIMTSRSGPDA